LFNEGYLATTGAAPIRRDLARDAEWLASLQVNLLPTEPESRGLLALIRLYLARWLADIALDGVREYCGPYRVEPLVRTDPSHYPTVMSPMSSLFPARLGRDTSF
jgi:hypothetical protein